MIPEDGPITPEADKILGAFRALLKKLSGSSDCDQRSLICTPCGGKYGDLAAWVVVIEGTPPRGSLFIGQGKYGYKDDVFFIAADSSKRIGDAQCRIVRAFEKAFLTIEEDAGVVAVVKIDGEPVALKLVSAK